MLKIGLFVCFIFSVLVTRAQVIITGRVADMNGVALSRINIMFFQPSSVNMVAYGITDDKGLFKVLINRQTDSLLVKISSISHRDQQRRIPNVTQELIVFLEADVKDLSGVEIKSGAIEKRGDTLSYLVRSFSQQQDRTIEDVIRHMPGIEVEDNGKILYEGIPINKFYIEGLDLMEGRYTVVSRNLPHSSVSAVEVIENHQPIQVLDDKVSSTQAAINLRIKKGVSLTGTANVGAGAAPFLRDIKLSPMVFTKKVQSVVSIQSNNTGKDVAGQVKMLTSDEDILINDTEKAGLLDTPRPPAPQMAQNLYLANDINLFNINLLTRFKTESTLRTNLYYYNDNQKEKSSLKKTIFLPDDTLRFSEYSEYEVTMGAFYGSISYNKNSKKNYLNNELKFRVSHEGATSMCEKENIRVNQSLAAHLNAVSNSFRSYFKVCGQMLEARSLIFYDKGPKNIEVNPGVFENVLNNAIPYGAAEQQSANARVITDNSLGLVFITKKIIFTPRIGLSVQAKSFTTTLTVLESGSDTMISAKYLNNMEYSYINPYFITGAEYKKKKVSWKYNLTIDWNTLKTNDHIKNANTDFAKLTTENRLTFGYNLNAYWKLRMQAGINSRLGNTFNSYSGYILQNYQSLSRNITPVSLVNNKFISTFLSYRNPITSFFGNINYLFNIGSFNNLTNREYLPDGSSLETGKSASRSAYTHSLAFYVSKFLPELKLTLTFRGNILQSSGKTMVNSLLFNSANHVIVLKPEISYRVTPGMNIDYVFEGSTFITRIEKTNKNDVVRRKHRVEYFVFPAKNQLVSLTGEYYSIGKREYLFADIQYRYTLISRKIDFEMRLNNLFNATEYLSTIADTASVWESSYEIRPRQFLLSARFRF